MMDYLKTIERAAEEMKAAAAGADPKAIGHLAKEIAKAKKIVLHGVGREGLMMRALAMRMSGRNCGSPARLTRKRNGTSLRTSPAMRARP